MIISLNWLKKFTNIDISVEDLSTLIGARLVEIESIANVGEKYQGAFVVKVVSVDALEGSDHLHVVKINDAGVMNDIERDSDGNIQVVCGAPNIAVDQMVVWLTPGAIVPNTYGKPDPFKLDSRVLRGVMSHGMIASARELDLSDEHDGILVLDGDIEFGKSFAESYELNDYLLDIENKSLTHRPDCFGVIGFAREIAAILGQKFETPDFMHKMTADFAKTVNDGVNISAVIEDGELSSRYLAVVMSGVDGSKKSPFMVQTYLSRVGVRPVNAVVDVTNYLMLLTGQPLHAFDYDKVLKVSGGDSEIHVRAGKPEENLKLLDGREIKLTTNDIVISAGDVAIGLAGAMGGADTEIDETTKRIIIESATFNLYNLRNTQMRFGIFSEAITRFTKGQPSELAMPVLNMAVKLMSEWTSAGVISELAESYPVGKNEIKIALDTEKINKILGTDLVAEDIVDVLENVGFCMNRLGSSQISAVAPYWRSDIHIIEDIAEEIGRVRGYDNISSSLPRRNFTAVKPNEFDEYRKKVRKILNSTGANEVLTYSFIHGDVIKKAGLDPNNSYKVVNSLSPDLQYYRQSLTASLLGLVHPNIKQSFDRFALYEINKAHSKINGLNEENVPVESDMLAMVFSSKNETNGSAYYVAKRMFDYLAERIGADIEYVPMDDEENVLFSPFETKRSAKIIDKGTQALIGVIGEYKKMILKSFKISEFTAGFEVDLMALFGISNGITKKYKPISRYPSIERDICFQVEPSVTYAQICNSINEELSRLELDATISPVDIYKSGEFSRKNVTVRVRLVSYEKTLTGEEVNEIINRIGSSAIKNVDAVII
jgi:phenylalanyl-tRNA synthetase beta chain